MANKQLILSGKFPTLVHCYLENLFVVLRVLALSVHIHANPIRDLDHTLCKCIVYAKHIF